jgi:hypothetical protein
MKKRPLQKIEAGGGNLGWSEPVPGRELQPLKSGAFSRRTTALAQERPLRPLSVDLASA